MENQTKNKNKRNKILIIILSSIIFLMMILPFYFSLATSSHVLVKNYKGKYYNARVIFMTQNFLICFKENKVYKKRKNAINANPSYSISYVSLNDVVQIELVFDIEEDDDEEETGTVPKKYLGKYKINLSGHEGYLIIRQKRGKLYATCRFPRWAKGALETLKRVRVRKNRIYFTRSVRTAKELRRIGANNYFVQKFKGEYIENGTMIVGKFTNRGAEQSWEAYKIGK